jgi:hypothetical protein
MTINLDETPMQSAKRTAETISAFVGAMFARVLHGQRDVVSDGELEAFAAMRDALHELASHEYDRGFRRAVAMRKENRGGADA